MDATTTLKSPPTWLLRLACALVLPSGFALWCNNASAEEVVQPSAASASGRDDYPACAAGLRLRAVQYDPNHEERSFATFAGSAQRAQPLRRGARVSGYAIERIQQGAVVLASQSQRCTVRLRGAAVERELRAISVEAVRGALSARPAAAGSHASVSGQSAPIKVGS